MEVAGAEVAEAMAEAVVALEGATVVGVVKVEVASAPVG